MNDRERLNRIQIDLQRATTVIYLEGKTDPECFFALLGIVKPSSDIHQNVYVTGLRNGPSGSSEVGALAKVAIDSGLGGTPGSSGVFGIIDGDGRDLPALAGEFDAPFAGPVFSWKAYCVESMVARTAWPTGWGAAPDWQSVLHQYVPYAALNRVHRSLSRALETFQLHRFRHPQHGQPLETDEAVRNALHQDKGLIETRDVEVDYDDEANAVRNAITASGDEGHTQIDGKWLFRHYARTVTSNSAEQCRREWIQAVQSAGGSPEVRAWWQRVTGSAP